MRSTWVGTDLGDGLFADRLAADERAAVSR